MRELLVILFFIFLIASGWKQSYREHFESIMKLGTGRSSSPGAVTPATPSSKADPDHPAPTQSVPPTQTSPWMWRKTTMDEPYKAKGTHER